MTSYDAFVSYSHAKDKPIAAALQSVIEKLGKPWYRRRSLRVFRDDTSLSATPQPWPTTERALGELRYFLLLASPEAALSKWVIKEVTHWLDHNSIETLLIGLTDGGSVGNQPGADIPTVYSITSSARSRMDVGTSRPSAFAVLRLIASLVLGRCLHRQSRPASHP